MPRKRPPRVLLADDHPGLLQGFQRLLESCCEIVGTVNDGRTLLDAVARLKPDVVVVDVTMPGLNGLDACCQIKQAAPRTKVVVVTAASDEGIKQKAFSVGASAFVLKHSAAHLLVRAVQSAFQESSS